MKPANPVLEGDPATEPHWHYSHEGQQGPVTLATLLEVVHGLPAARDTLVWRPGLTAWTRAADVPEIACRLWPEHAELPPWFMVSVPKLVLMSVTTLGIYEIYWFWQHWLRVKARTQEDMRPFWRAMFSVLFCHSLFTRLNDDAREREMAGSWTPGMLAATFIALTIAQRLPDPYWLVTFFAVWPLAYAQRTANAISLAATPFANPNRAFSPANWVALLFGSLLLLLTVAGTLLPEAP